MRHLREGELREAAHGTHGRGNELCNEVCTNALHVVQEEITSISKIVHGIQVEYEGKEIAKTRGAGGEIQSDIQMAHGSSQRRPRSVDEFGAPKAQQGENANMALQQRTIKLMAGEPLPIFGHTYFPWWAPKETSGQYVHLLSEGPSSQCRFIDALFWNKSAERCALVIHDKHVRSRLFEAEMDQSTGVARKPPINKRDMSPFDMVIRDKRWAAFVDGKSAMVYSLRKLLDVETRSKKIKVQNEHTPLLVMCANDGHLGLILNWACSLRAAKISMPRHVIFVTSDKTRTFLETLGFTAYYDKRMGTFPAEASGRFSDTVFGMMMVLKQASVSLALETGFDIVFQDVDVTWVQDPIPMLREQSKYYEVQFQDDGARNELFGPWNANTGFFYMRGTLNNREFWNEVSMMMPSTPQSNQAMVNYVLEGYARRGHPFNKHSYPVHILSQDEFVSGNGIDVPGVPHAGCRKLCNIRPLSPTAKVVHFCWTHNITFKIRKMEAYQSLYVAKRCLEKWSTCVPEPSVDWSNQVCQHQKLPPMAENYDTWRRGHFV